MKRYSIVHPFVLSFFSKDLYQDVARNWKGSGFLYLLLLLSVCWIPATIKIVVGMSNFAAIEGPLLINQIPNINITNGEAFITEPMPYLIKSPKTGETFAIIDTTGQTTTLEDPKAIALLTKTTLIFREQPGSANLRGYDLSQVKEFTLTKDRLYGWLGLARTLLPICIYPILLLGSYVYRIVQSLFYAAIGLIFVALLKAHIHYTVLVRLSVIAVTPVLILDTLLGLTGKQIPGWNMLCLFIALAYLRFGVAATVSAERLQRPALLEQHINDERQEESEERHFSAEGSIVERDQTKPTVHAKGIQVCKGCGTRVLPTSAGKCPACGAVFGGGRNVESRRVATT